MAIALTALNSPNTEDNTQRRVSIEGMAVLSGSYTTGGETVNFLTLSSASGGKVLVDTLQTAPIWVEFQMDTPAATPLLIIAVYNYTTNKLQFYVSSTGAELAAGAYAAGYIGTAKLRFKVEFPREI